MSVIVNNVSNNVNNVGLDMNEILPLDQNLQDTLTL